LRLSAALGRSTAAFAVGALVCVGMTAGQAALAAGQGATGGTLASSPGVYVVALTSRPAAAYGGGLAGFRATQPRPGQRFDRSRPAVSAYAVHLRQGQDRLLSRIGGPTVLYRYTTALDGFAARLTSSQVRELRGTPGVALVERSTKGHVDSLGRGKVSSVLNLSSAQGLWASEGGPADAGKGTVIGVVDSGIWPENPSFAGLPQKTPGRSAKLPGFHGACSAADGWTARNCNDKVVSARWFVRGFGAGGLARSDYLSPRDGTGHGTHTASTAAGDHGVRVRIQGQDFGTLSGIAPAARIAVYKACWTGPDPDNDGCTTADTVAAVDRAVGDGVDVLNYSVSGSGDPADAVSLAFLNASAAGVFVATAAGNDGPRAGAVEHVSPWVTTVGSSTRRVFRGSVVLGDGTALSGAMVSARKVSSTGLVLGRDVPAPGATRRAAALCDIGALDAEQVQGKIVVCDRGVTARVDKATAVSLAGGVGMVLANTAPGGTDADVQDVPTVHLNALGAHTVKAYVDQAGAHATAALDPHGQHTVDVPRVAGFSSRGPVLATRGGLLKPDLTAPGVNVLGAVAPPTDAGRFWDLDSGTSTSAPHVSGLAADMRGVHPDWAPARIKSALMTTAEPLASPDGPFAGGAGHVDPLRILDPGLVFDAGPAAWHRFLDGRTRPQDLNLPSVAVGELVGRAKVVRRVTNVAHATETYTARVSELHGVNVSVAPSTMTLAPGQTRSFTLSFTAGPTASLDRFTRGSLTWTSARHQVHSPMVVRPRALAAPREVAGAGGSGTTVVHGRAGTARPVRLRSSGLVPASSTGVTLVPGAFDGRAPTQDADTVASTLRVPGHTELARFEMATDTWGDRADLYVYRGRTLVGSAISGAADSTVTLTNPKPGAYTVYVNGHHAANGSTITGQLYTWVVNASGDEPLSLSAQAVDGSPGRGFQYRASWTGLDPTKRWLGVVRYSDSGKRTLLQIG
jgi:Subtilase family/Fibronectin type-III domain/PA domain/Peptidase inhibitor I9